MNKKTLILLLFIIMGSVSSSFGFFYQATVFPLDAGSVQSSIESRTNELVTEHYLAVPAPGYVFDSWSLYPRGEHNESLYVHKFDPRLFYTLEIKTITANFVKLEDKVEQSESNIDIRQIDKNSVELSFPTISGLPYMVYSSKNLKDWDMAESFARTGNGQIMKLEMPLKSGVQYFRIHNLREIDINYAVTGLLRVQWSPEFPGGSLRVRLWEYHPLIADKAADLFAERTIEWPSRGSESKLTFEIGDASKADPNLNYYITAELYEKGKVGDLDSRLYFLNGFNRVDIPSAFGEKFLTPLK